MNIKIPAVILAGGSNSPEMTSATGQSVRALVPIAGKTMLEYIITALSKSTTVGDIVVVGSVPNSPLYKVVQPGQTLVENLFSGMEAVASEGNVLIVTADIPFITSEGIDDFVDKATAAHSTLCYPIISMTDYNMRFPGLKRTTLKTKEGTFTGGNIMLVEAQGLQSSKQIIQEAYAARKSVTKLGAQLGLPLLMRVLVSQLIAPSVLSIQHLEAGVSRLIGNGATAKAITTPYAEIGTDVDKPEDVVAAELVFKALS